MKQRIYIWIWIAIALLLLTSCRGIRYVPVETVRTDSLHITVHERDSIHIHDSIYVRENGDTVFVDRWHTIYRDKLRTDTMYVSRTDSVLVQYPVEKELTKWQKVKMELGGWVFGAIVLFSMVIVGWMVFKRMKK